MKKVVIVSDLHCGNRIALTPPAFWNTYTPEGVKWLWECWLAFIKRAGKCDLLILNGDMVDGKQRRSDSIGLITSSMKEQTNIAIECLTPLAERAGKIVRTEGTAYHETFDGPLNAMDIAFNIYKPPDYRQRIIIDIRLDDNAVLNVKHQPEGEGALYRGTTMDREMLWAKLTEACKHIPTATHIVRSHLHSDGHMRAFGKEMNFTGCWCLQAPYALMKRAYRWTPDIGGLIIEKDARGFKGWLSYPVNFDLPTFEAINYEAM